ncbi:hypothetical protein [Burkholderia cenocepacia]|uniref:hypothetical protein n=1 Tax=Burkholderia cenocepacia TaxID=95486 RepID=UPI001B97D2C7|nr:hypothetical protein [Burkholderia cenocepacia]MBR8137192.1 hypothetical protein [Burkholderia cenocepacia]
MKKVPYFNDSDRFKHIGGVTIPPGETREVEAVFVAAGPAPTQASDGKSESTSSGSTDVDIATLQTKTAAVIKDAILTLSDEQLVALNTAEEAANAPRKGVLEAIAAEQLNRAQG